MSSWDDYNEGLHDRWECKPSKDKNISYEIGYYSDYSDSDFDDADPVPHYSGKRSRYWGNPDYNVFDGIVDLIVDAVIVGTICAEANAVVTFIALFGIGYGLVFLHMLFKDWIHRL